MIKWTFIIYAFFLASCQHQSFISKFEKAFEQSCHDNQRDCIISIIELTDFDWDEIVIFNDATSLKEAEIKLGKKDKIDLPSSDEYMIIFLLENMIVYQEEFKGRVFFHSLEIKNPWEYAPSYTPKTAIFSVVEKTRKYKSEKYLNCVPVTK